MKNKTLWIIVGLLIVVILLLFMCRKTKTVEIQKPDVVTVYEVKKWLTKDTIAYNHLRDSFNNVVYRLKVSLYVNQNSLLNEQDKTLELQQENDELLSKLEASELTEEIISQADRIKRNGEIKDSLYTAGTSNLSKQIFNKDKQIEESEKLAKRINASLDTCLKSQSLLDKFADKVKPRNKLAVGFVANVYPYAGVGFGSDFITKQNMIYSATGTYMQKNWYIHVAVKKVISFR